jgi:hypothetical protein
MDDHQFNYITKLKKKHWNFSIGGRRQRGRVKGTWLLGKRVVK